MGNMCMEKSKASTLISKDSLPKGIKYVYMEGFPGKETFTVEKGKECYHEDYVSHANVIKPGEAGPGPEGMCQLIKGFSTGVEQWKWEVQEVYHVKMAVGDKWIIVSTCSGIPKEKFLEIEPTGNGFIFMAIDVHWVTDGKVKESWHIEELAPAVGMLEAKEGKKAVPPLHDGQMPNFGMYLQEAPGQQITASQMPECVKFFYEKALNHDKDCTEETLAEKCLHENWVSHPNSSEKGKAGPGAKGQFKILEGLKAAIPDAKFETEAVFKVPCMKKCDRIVHIGKFSGTTDGKQFGLELASPKKFIIMAIDIHLIEKGKIKESWHIEDWASAIGQLKSDKEPKLHNGQPGLNGEVGMKA
mmetsp:Transcript_45814/g.82453  ORF Transcript_45814/g.82453 Transcript_45814/m.82453 type:complete len:358 (-) Transcript_45814:259-1332(-)|eukprot:CAMPEP_0197666376 /NCGR_PEP_ID=MMETSP1338-20131121/62319_1 /TAXON_ID=43686 ORGANISM="Pelagodinium beii, Strain RCC1491" /NCGR_SAMPLE_ID=MMETSP1338 /ASSEMBLY_ACC=CAM_ASM_000754 /LENGTH=357 /DNA_ID=CAMNT_0043245395 /DNA_START=39 /DNA_END=1112 /DNA_ORIENTATION=+